MVSYPAHEYGFMGRPIGVWFTAFSHVVDQYYYDLDSKIAIMSKGGIDLTRMDARTKARYATSLSDIWRKDNESASSEEHSVDNPPEELNNASS